MKSIKKNLKGYFINRKVQPDGKISDKLCKKISATDYEVLDNVNTPNGLISAYDNCIRQINCQIVEPELYICTLDDLLPVINGDTFDFYKMREKHIQKYIKWCQCVQTEENELSKGRYLVYWKKRKNIIYAVVMDDTLTPVPENLVDDHTKEKAVRIRYPKLLERALQDDKINQFKEDYEKEIKKYISI